MEHQHGRGRGPNSMHMQDPTVVFERLNLKKGETLLDLGCGAGSYSIRALDFVGSTGRVYAVDRNPSAIRLIGEEINKMGMANLFPVVADITQPLPMDDNGVDVCLLTTVLHTIHPAEVRGDLFMEIARVLKPDGRVVIIDVKKEEQSFGPPMNMRLSPQETEELMTRCGFEKQDDTLFQYTYLSRFTLPAQMKPVK